jgi:glycosyltransferase involved in cell wall biosynthesis
MEDDYFATAYRDEPSRKFYQIPYFGYEEEEFEDIDQIQVYASSREPLRIAYTGVFYEGGRSPEHFLDALSQFIGARQLGDDRLQMTFAGSWGKKYDELVTSLGLDDFVEYVGFVSRARCLDLCGDSHILLLLGAPEGLDRNFPSKFWDYLGARRVILGLVAPESRVAQCIIREDLGVVAHPTDVGAIRRSIAVLYDRFSEGDLGVAPSGEFLKSASRAECERRFASVLDSALKSS